MTTDGITLDLDQLEEALLALDESMQLDQVEDEDHGTEGIALEAKPFDRLVVCWADGDITIEHADGDITEENVVARALLDDETGALDYEAIARRMWQLLTGEER